MMYDEWMPLYRKLVRTYNKTENGDQCVAYYDALKTHRLAVVEQAVSRSIGEEKFFPSVAAIRERMGGVVVDMAPRDTCQTCHGNLWVDAPDRAVPELGGRVYQEVRRCPTCWTFGAAL